MFACQWHSNIPILHVCRYSNIQELHIFQYPHIVRIAIVTIFQYSRIAIFIIISIHISQHPIPLTFKYSNIADAPMSNMTTIKYWNMVITRVPQYPTTPTSWYSETGNVQILTYAKMRMIPCGNITNIQTCNGCKYSNIPTFVTWQQSEYYIIPILHMRQYSVLLICEYCEHHNTQLFQLTINVI